jgi:hypothetical protein
MRIRSKAAALASSAIAIAGLLAGTGVLAGTTSAYANQTVAFYITNLSGSQYWLINAGGTAEVSQPVNDGNDFTNIYGAKWGSRPVYEWQDLNASNLCLTSEGAGGAAVKLLGCQAGNKNQLWWQTTGGQLLNWGATGSGSGQCLNASHASDGSQVDIIGCKTKSQPGWFDQYWTSRG